MSAPASGPARPGNDIPYELFLDCVHCGLCTAACPTYAELGNENDSPRGRIYLMRSVVDGRLELGPSVRRHLELCLDCRACETACPSGVQYGKLIEPFRIAMEQDGAGRRKTDDWFHRWILFGMFPYPRRLRRALVPARWAQRLGLDRLADLAGLLNLVPTPIRQMVRLLPPAVRSDQQPLPTVLPAKGERRARVGLFIGCVGDVLFRQTHWATARVLQENGCEVHVPAGQQCCGAIHFHAGSGEPARQMADANLQAFGSDLDAVVVNVAGCGSMLKDYGLHWNDGGRDQRQAFARRVRDIHEFLDELGVKEPAGSLPLRAVYHDACHLAHAQKIRQAPRSLLGKIPALELVELPEADLCCGAAGSYNLTEAEMARRLGERKLQNILSTGAQAVISPNAGCTMQIAMHARQAGRRLPILHPMELLDRSYRGLSIDELR